MIICLCYLYLKFIPRGFIAKVGEIQEVWIQDDLRIDIGIKKKILIIHTRPENVFGVFEVHQCSAEI